MRGISHIAIRSPNWIGDHILALPFYRAVRAHYPRARITLLHPPALSDLIYPECFNDHWLLSPAQRRSASGLWALGRRVYAARFELAVVLPATLRAALPFFLGRVPARVGFAGDGSAIFLTSHLRWRGVEAGCHKSELYQQLGDLLLAPRVVKAEGASGARDKHIVVAPGASITLREWPHQKELLEGLRREFPSYRIIYVGTAEQSAYSRWLDTVGDPLVENRIGQTSLADVLALCRRAAAVVANDSGIAHLAATLAHAPTVVLFGPGAPHYVTPLGSHVEVVRDAGLPCSPCEKPYCRAPYGYQACLQRVSPSAVLSAVRSCL